MNIAVIGAGIVGLCTAYELQRDGHQVTVFERNASVAQEASFACAGLLSPSFSHPFAFPGWAANSWWRAMARPAGVRLGSGLRWQDLRWLYHWKKPGKAHIDKLAIAHALANYSLERLHALQPPELATMEQAQGHLLLWKSGHQSPQHQERLAAMKEWGLVSQTLTPQEARQLEPALHTDVEFESATYFPQDEVGNCRQFAHLLKDKLTQAGVALQFGTPVRSISTTPGLQLLTYEGPCSVDQIVLTAGTETPTLMPPAKPLPLGLLWSYTLSTPIREPLNAPQGAVQDMHSRMCISRLGMRVRVSGGAELGARSGGNHAGTVQQLYRALNTLFPGAADFGRSAQVWKGCSAFTPDGLPLIGPSSTPGIWLNACHGQSGWTMACGAARLIADQIAGKASDVDATKFHFSRFHA